MYERILVPTDGSRGTERAVDNALDIAQQHGGTVHVLYVVDTSVPSTGMDGIPASRDSIVEERRRVGEQATARIEERATDAGVETVVAVREGDIIHRTILEYADENDIDLIVMGTHGRKGFRRLLIGSVTERVVRTADIPVLTVRMTPEQIEE